MKEVLRNEHFGKIYDGNFQSTDPFRNEKNLQIGNWQDDTDTLIAVIKAQTQNFPEGFRDCITRIICDMKKF